VVRAWIYGKIVHLGTFDKEKMAAKTVRKKYLEVYGELPGNTFADISDDDQNPMSLQSKSILSSERPSGGMESLQL